MFLPELFYFQTNRHKKIFDSDMVMLSEILIGKNIEGHLQMASNEYSRTTIPILDDQLKIFFDNSGLSYEDVQPKDMVNDKIFDSYYCKVLKAQKSLNYGPVHTINFFYFVMLAPKDNCSVEKPILHIYGAIEPESFWSDLLLSGMEYNKIFNPNAEEIIKEFVYNHLEFKKIKDFSTFEDILKSLP